MQGVSALHARCRRLRVGTPGEGEPRGKVEGLARGQAADEAVLLLDIAADLADSRERRWRTIDVDSARDHTLRGNGAMGKDVKQLRVASER